MAILVTLQGPDAGRKFPLEGLTTVLGRQADAHVCLPAKAVSRQHAQILESNGAFLIEDLGSSNGTFLNGNRLGANVRVPLTENDTFQVGPYLFGLRPAPTPTTAEPDLVIREQVNVTTLSHSVYGQDPAQKLQVVLEIAQSLARTLDLEQLLGRLLDQLMRLFPTADRAMVLLCEQDRLVVRASRLRPGSLSRHDRDGAAHPYSRTIVHKALDEGLGILSEDVKGDQRFEASHTLTSLEMRSLLCVPLLAQDGRRLGVLQVDRFRPGLPFRTDDLQLLSTIAMQVSVVLENAALHVELLQKERQDQELALAREIQQGFLPADFDEFPPAGFELFARVEPAREVSGDLYDLFPLGDGRLAFFVGDVSGKGMPAALSMVAVHTLCRHLAGAEGAAALPREGPAATLGRLNAALAGNNPSGQFVTLAHGVYDPAQGEVTMASAGHPLPLLRREDGRVEDLSHRSGRMLGYDGPPLNLRDVRFGLAPGDLMVFYTDGFTEAREPDNRELFGTARLRQVVAGFEPSLPLAVCTDRALQAIREFTRSPELQDDMTLFLLRRLR
jgi:serine phosphatase RsbU (regulator of sigma subunit)/pSer/pThr/pTyr-binding forkhead associated (FHA) protein